MSKKLYISHENEEKLVTYCARKNLTFDVSNAYDLTLEAFKDEPIMLEEEDDNGEKKKKNITKQIASFIEDQPKIISRLTAKILRKREELMQSEYETNIKKAKIGEKPDLDFLVDNLYQLNIVDKNSYLALVCFLMQLRYTRDAEIPEDDKTCLFFNGVARNGKSATGKAIAKLESKYGRVFQSRGGKAIEGTHEEQVWKSHCNFFDEAKPSQLSREFLLTLINGGENELNPKNKALYSYHVNTNNIFASNDQINMMQRRISVVKFGDRFYGKPLEKGFLVKIMGHIMDSLPSFDHYYDIYNTVSLANENRINPLAIEAVITCMNDLFSHVTPEAKNTLALERVFSSHDVFECIKRKHNKETISSERRKAINITLDYLCQKGYISIRDYDGSTSTFYVVYGRDFLRLREEFGKVNTSEELNIKVSKQDLKLALAPYFRPISSAPTPNPTKDESKEQKRKISEYEYNKIASELDHLKTKEVAPDRISGDTLRKACRYFGIFKKANERIMQETNIDYNTPVNPSQIAFLAKTTMTKELCDCVHYDVIITFYREKFTSQFTDLCRRFILKKYCELIHCVDLDFVRIQAETKAQDIPHFFELTGVTIPSKFEYKKGSLDSYIARKKMNSNKELLPFSSELGDWNAWFKALGKMQEDQQQSREQEPFLPQFEDLADSVPF